MNDLRSGGGRPRSGAAPCPLCGSGSRRLWEDPRAPHECSGCGVVWTPPLSPSAVETYSASYYDLYYRPRGAALLEHFAAHLAALGAYLPRDRWLDVGCGGGYFAAAGAAGGWRVTGIDPSADALRLARSVAPQARLVQGGSAD